ncbi:MAG TPA: FAD binding domain-containing protein [Caldilineaceae bacterium]|nr:FAD binding domain-containing protein [Caldilineaceae bacterium]
MSLWQSYHTPTTIVEALRLLSAYQGRAQIIAGGTDLLLDMQYNHHPPVDALVDVTRIEGLDAICQAEDWIVVGAAATHRQIERSPLIRRHGTALVESCRVVGGPQVRNVATIGGNVAHALPAADGTIGLLALDAQAQVCTLHEDGTVASAWQPLLSLFAGPGRNTLRPNQLLAAFRFRARQPRQASAFDRIMRPQGVALPILAVAAKVTLDPTQTRVTEATIAIGPAGPVPFRASEAEAVLAGGATFDDELVEAAVAAAQAQAQLRASRHRASREYRHEMVAVLLRRVLHRAAARAIGDEESR